MVLGPGGGALDVMLLPAQLGLGGPLGTGRQWWSWVALEDAVGALEHALHDETLSGSMNVVAPTPIRQHEFQRVLGRVLSRPSFMPAPAFALKMVLGTFAEEVLASKRVLPEALTGRGYSFVSEDLEETLRTALRRPLSQV
jgi:uncharacterized protein (TIGR01777 family)